MAKRTKKKSTRRKKSSGKKFNFRDERITKIFGAICFFIAIYLTIAFISYFFTWKFDQDKVLSLSGGILFDGEVSVQNWLGRLGAFTSHFFFYWGFGLSSFLFVLLFAKLGTALIRKTPLSEYFNFALHTFLLICFFSVLMEFITRDSAFCWGGLMGYSICNYLINFVGQVGLVLLLILMVFATFIWVVNPLMQIQGVNLAGLTDRIPIPKMDFIGESLSALFPEKRAFDTTEEEAEVETEKLQTLRPRDLSKDKGESAPEEGLELDLEVGGEAPTEEAKPSISAKAASIMAASALSAKLAAKEESTAPSGDLELELASPETPLTDDNGPTKGPDMDSTKLYVEEENQPSDVEPYDPTKELSKYKFPTTELLENYSEHQVTIDRQELEENKNQIIKTLLNYKIEITKIKATIGPTVTLYEIVPAPGVKISKIKSLENDIALSLAALGIRIIAPMPGKGTVGIEVPNKKKQIVSFKEVVNSDKFQNAKMDLPIVLGKTISNEVFVADLAKMPHLLVAGATGQGKSVGINTILMSLLYKKHPSQVKLVMVDPKKVELFPYSSLDKHYLGFLPSEDDEPIITDTKKVIHTLNSLTIEMDERYDLLKKGKARNIKDYNKKFVGRKLNPNDGHRFLPYIILVIDEFADLIMTAGKEIEMPIARLAQLARAIGIHLIIATQRPSVKIITGMIKANFPARISFKVTSLQDSRTILDSKGAEQLIGKGDMLLNVGSDLVRLQCAFVDTPEVERVIEHISEQKGFAEPFHLPEVVDDTEVGGSNLKWSELDPKFEEAARLIVSSQSGSTSSIQRRLSLGYNRAGRIMDQLENLGIVGEANGSKPRQVLFTSEMELTHYFEHLKSNG